MSETTEDRLARLAACVRNDVRYDGQTAPHVRQATAEWEWVMRNRDVALGRRIVEQVLACDVLVLSVPDAWRDALRAERDEALRLAQQAAAAVQATPEQEQPK